MKPSRLVHSVLSVCVLCLLAVLAALADDWPQWGGANRNFMTNSKGLASSWPSGGPKLLWVRTLGEGYSGVAVEDGRLFTMYRESSKMWQPGRAAQEVVIAMDASAGKTIWEYRYDAPELPKMNLEYGPGPHATPLVVNGRVFAAGAMGKFSALDKNTGKLVWSHDFYQEFGVVWGRGYSCSPIAYKNTVIVTLGQAGRSVMALDQSDGKIVWQKQEFDYGPSSPILITLEDEGAGAGKSPAKSAGKAESRNPAKQEQLVVFMANEIAGLDPGSGELLWSHPHKTDWGLNISTPVWSEGNLLFCSSAYSGGSRMLRLALKDGKTSVEQLWFTSRMRIHIGNAIRVGDFIHGSSGDFGPAFFAAIDVKTGQVAWQDRSFAKASSVYADGKLVILDEDGNLALAGVSPQGLNVLSRASLDTGRAWTPPTLVGTHLYIRDRKNLRALDLS